MTRQSAEPGPCSHSHQISVKTGLVSGIPLNGILRGTAGDSNASKLEHHPGAPSHDEESSSEDRVPAEVTKGETQSQQESAHQLGRTR